MRFNFIFCKVIILTLLIKHKILTLQYEHDGSKIQFQKNKPIKNHIIVKSLGRSDIKLINNEVFNQKMFPFRSRLPLRWG
jgi:hypothetical protein